MKTPTTADIYKEINDLRKELQAADERLEEKVDKTYVRLSLFEAEVTPLKKVLYGIVSIAGTAFITAIMGLILAAK